VNYPLRLLVQPDDVTLTVQDAEGAAIFHAAKRPDPNTPKEDVILVSADAEHSRPLYTMSRAFPKWFHVHDAEGREVCMIHERPAKGDAAGMDIYDVGDPILHIGKDTTAPARAGGLGGLFKGLVARSGPSGYQVTTPDATPVLRLHPDGAPDRYVIARLQPLTDLNERRALISLLGVVLHPLARPARRR
jgi:hypothetical protein